jgi:hypothetical protein
MRRIFFALVAAVALSSGGAQAESGYSLEDFELRTGQDLLDMCTLDANHRDYPVAHAYCVGFIEGAGQLHDALAAGPEFDRLVCAPKNVTLDDVVTVYSSYAAANPQYMRESAIDSLVRAAAAKWPCGK